MWISGWVVSERGGGFSMLIVIPTVWDVWISGWVVSERGGGFSMLKVIPTVCAA